MKARVVYLLLTIRDLKNEKCVDRPGLLPAPPSRSQVPAPGPLLGTLHTRAPSAAHNAVS